VKAELYHWLESALYKVRTENGFSLVPFKPNTMKVSEVTRALAAIGHARESLDRLCWLAGTTAADIVAMKNGLLHEGSGVERRAQATSKRAAAGTWLRRPSSRMLSFKPGSRKTHRPAATARRSRGWLWGLWPRSGECYCSERSQWS
jgi:hypothetical protein